MYVVFRLVMLVERSWRRVSIARRAVDAGVTLTIDSDCHRAEALERQMRFGVGTARRGWVQSSHVLNTRSADAVRAFVARKRNSKRDRR